MIRFIRTTLILGLFALFGEVFLRPMMSIGGVGPDFTLIALAVLALGEGAFAATIGGFVMGLLLDTSVPSLLGLHALCKSLTGFGIGSFRSRLVYGLPLVEGSVIAGMVLFHDTLYTALQGWLSTGPFFQPFFLEILPTAVYTGLVGVPVLRVAGFLDLLGSKE